MKFFRFALLGLTLACWSRDVRATVVVDHNDSTAMAHDAVGTDADSAFTGTTIPMSTTVDAVDGSNYSKNTVDFYVIGGQTVFSFAMEHKRNGTLNSIAETHVKNFYFTTDIDTNYNLSGYYNVTDAREFGGSHLRAALQDVTGCCSSPYQKPPYIFDSIQLSVSTPSEHLLLGGNGGDYSNFLLGSLTGNLLAGHRYLLIVDGSTIALNSTDPSPDVDSGAIALGNVTLKIGEVQVVAEPATGLLFSILGPVSMYFSARRRSKIRHEV
jgi:hypothetical protein